MVGANGDFQVDSVPPGSYTLRLSASPPGTGPFGDRNGGPSSSQTVEVTVPEGSGPTTPIDLGEIVLPPAKKSQGF
jgi:hypothetical protein